MMYGWLPVGHNWQKCNLPPHKCPCFGADNETFEHLMKCKNDSLRAVRASAVTIIRLNCKKLKLPLNFTSNFLHIIRMTLDDWKPPQVDEIPSELLGQAIRDQSHLGPYRLIIGFMSNSWTDALDGFGVKQPQSMMEQLLAIIWDELCEKIWDTRHEILHSSQSMTILDEMKTIEHKVLWFQSHQHAVLDYHHRFLAGLRPGEIN